MGKLSLFLMAFLTVGPLAAKPITPIIKPIGLAEKIIVRGFKGRLQLVPTESETVKVEAEQKGSSAWDVQVRNKQNTLEILVRGPSEQESFQKWKSGAALPHFDMKVTAPARAIEVFWNEGELISKSWGSGLSLQMTKGKVHLRETQGSIKIQLIQGRIDVAKHQGPMDIQSFKGETSIKTSKGALTLDNHSARYQLEAHEGPLNIRNHSGTFTLTKVTGSAQVKNVSGVLRLRDFSGSFVGDFTKGALDARVKNLQSFVVNSADAGVTLDAPKESGAHVSLRSEKGRLIGPPYLGKIKKGRWTERKGRLKGKEQGNIKIVSKYGDIVLK